MRELIPSLWVGILLVFAVLAINAFASADQSTDKLDLARICWHEAGVEITDDCRSIYAVLRRRAERQSVSFATMARRYSGQVFNRDRTDPRRWAAHLRPGDRPPLGWPSRLQWARWQPRWERLYQHAGAIVRGEIEPKCEPDHWGMRHGIDWARAVRAGWQLVDCGYTHGAFWRVNARPVPARVAMGRGQ